MFERSAGESRSRGGLTEAQSLLNLNRLLERSPFPDRDFIDRNRTRVLAVLETQPDSRGKAYALINLATSFPRFQAQPGNEILDALHPVSVYSRITTLIFRFSLGTI